MTDKKIREDGFYSYSQESEDKQEDNELQIHIFEKSHLYSYAIEHPITKDKIDSAINEHLYNRDKNAVKDSFIWENDQIKYKWQNEGFSNHLPTICKNIITPNSDGFLKEWSIFEIDGNDERLKWSTGKKPEQYKFTSFLNPEDQKPTQ